MNIHRHMKEKTDLATTYAKDGAFRTAARVLNTLASDLVSHAEATDFPKGPGEDGGKVETFQKCLHCGAYASDCRCSGGY